jgi:hypothetical protein
VFNRSNRGLDRKRKYRLTHSTAKDDTPVEPTEQPPENSLERLAREGYDRTTPRSDAFSRVAIASKAPIAKVTHGAMGAAGLVVIIYLLRTIFKLQLPKEVEDSIGVLLLGLIVTAFQAGIAYLTPIKRREIQ